MEDKPFDPALYHEQGLVPWLNRYIVEKKYDTGNCESSSFTLCWYLKPFSDYVYVVQVAGKHTFIFFDKKWWIDIDIGVVFTNDDIRHKIFSKPTKLSNFDQKYFDTYWGDNGVIENDMLFSFIKFVKVSNNQLRKEIREL
jgi:hypothetical protein